MTRSSRFLAAVVACLAIPSYATAALKDAGPVTATSFGFPSWYRDTSGTAVSLCTEQRQSPNASAAGAPMCFPLPPDPAGYPGNIGGEIFYYNASTGLAGANGFSLLWEGAIEATYANGTPVKGDEITFARIRIVMDTSVAGTYTVTHPYGQEVFPDVKGGKRAVFFTVDVGVNPGVFTGALGGGVGPFLEWDQNVANPNALFGIDPASGAAYSLAITNPDGSQVAFVGDPNFTHTVTGSPFLQNFVRVQGPPGSNLDGAGNDFLQTNLFAVLGQRYTVPIPQALVVYRTGYSIDTRGYAMVDVFAESVPGAKLIATATNVPTTELFTDPTTGDAFGHTEFFPAGAIGSLVTVTNVNDAPPSSASVPLTDVVYTSQAVLFPDPTGATTGALSIVAQTSVQQNPPALAIVELPGALKTVDPATPWVQRFDATIPAGVTPPWHLTAQSAMGGLRAEPVILGAANVVASVGPTALPLTASTAEATAVVIPAVDPASPTAAVIILSQPASGTAVAGAGTITYTPKNLFFGADSFTYLLSMPDPANPLKTVYSAVGAVLVDVVTVNNPPTAVADSGSTTSGVAVTINLAANDTDVDGTVVPASVVVVTAPPAGSGTLVNNADGTIIFTPTAAFFGSFTLQYTIADDGGAVSAPGTVTILVVAGAETLNVTRFDYVVKSSRYRTLGTSTVFGVGIANTVTVRAGTHAAPGVVIGSAVIDALGNWTVDVTNPVVIPCGAAAGAPAGRCPATVSSTGGGWRDFQYQER